MRMGRLSKFLVWAVLGTVALPAAALDFSPMVLRRANTQGLVSELFLYDLTPLEIHQLRLRMLQPLEDAMTLSYEPTLADLMPSQPLGPGDQLLTLLRPVGAVSAVQRGQLQDTVLIVFQGTTLHARRYRMPSTSTAFSTSASNSVTKAQRPTQTVAMLKPGEAADPALIPDLGADSNAAALSDITAAVKRWARAWEQRDVTAYAAAYEGDFRGAGTAAPAASNAAWLAQRRERILSKRDIEVALEDVQVSVQRAAPNGMPQANVRFVQRYRGDALKSITRKRLGLVLRDGKWLIREEVSL
jgi:Domain of unknown function (DUF4440)